MKKIAFLSLSFFLLYVAGLYRQPVLMSLAVAQFFLAAAMLFQTRYCRRHLKIEFWSRAETAYETVDFQGRLKIKNTGKIPVSRFRVKISIKENEEKRVRSLYVSGSAEPGNRDLFFKIDFIHCGLAAVRIESVHVYDYFSLWKVKKKVREEMTAAVFPGNKALELSFSKQRNNDAEDENYRQMNSGHGEIRQLREYIQGDTPRHIHWKMSARIGELFIKEYEKETGEVVRVTLDMRNFGRQTADEKDVFYKLLWGLLQGILSQGETAEVRNMEEPDWFLHITDEESSRILFLELYNKHAGNVVEYVKWRKKQDRNVVKGFLADGLGNLYYDGELLYRFSSHTDRGIQTKIAQP